MTLQTDFLVIGSGIAGLSYALKIAEAMPEKLVTIICKSKARETNTKYAQGGIAAAMPECQNSIESHIKDTLKAGGRLCDKRVVEFVVKESANRLKELMDIGVNFDKTSSGSYDLAQEGGHSEQRIFHRGDYTGLEIEKKLLAAVRKKKNIVFMENTIAIDLITNQKKKGLNSENECYGASVLTKSNKIEVILSQLTLLATGGVGQIFEHTTNSSVATGDGIAMAWRAGAKIRHMEFIQFHPTALYEKDGHTPFLISEAVRGYGGILKTASGEPFMQKYSLQKDLATRDIVSRAIQNEIRRQESPFVFLDCTHISKKEFLKHFPTIFTKCVGLGIHPSKRMIPVKPAAHYCCGGITTDDYGRTNVKRLYAIGECASTGLHGSNRLASNSLLEALVFAHRAAGDGIKFARGQFPKVVIPELIFKISSRSVINNVHLLKRTMSESFNITTTDMQLKNCLSIVEDLALRYQLTRNSEISTQILEFRNMIDVSRIIIKSALKRRTNRGVYYNADLEIRNKEPTH